MLNTDTTRACKTCSNHFVFHEYFEIFKSDYVTDKTIMYQLKQILRWNRMHLLWDNQFCKQTIVMIVSSLLKECQNKSIKLTLWIAETKPWILDVHSGILNNTLYTQNDKTQTVRFGTVLEHHLSCVCFPYVRKYHSNTSSNQTPQSEYICVCLGLLFLSVLVTPLNL